NRQGRLDRVEAMVSALRGAGVNLTADAVMAEAKRVGSVGRPHVADALITAGRVRNRQEAFDAWLGDGKVAHVVKRNLGLRQAVELIHGAGGVAILAHPGRRKSGAEIEDLLACGLDGLEVTHPSHGPDDVARLRALVE